MKSTVSITHTNDTSESGIRKAILETVEKTNFNLGRRLRTVLLKVNLRYYWDYSTGETTDPRVVAGIVDYIRGICDDEVDVVVAEADASAMRTKYAFRMLGYEKLAHQKSVRLLNLCECEKVEKEVRVNNRTFKLPIAQPMLDADMLINIPKLRTHRLTKISCSLKNLFGAIAMPRKIVYHPHLNEVIVGINKLIKPQLTIVDGIIALGKNPVEMGLILASEDQLAVDYVAASIMGFNPARIKHLTLAEREGVGRVKNIEVVGDKDINKFSKRFPRQNIFFFNFKWNLKLRLLDFYLKVTEDTRPPVLDK